VLVVLSTPAWCQPPSPEIKLSGPRVGVTFLDAGTIETLAARSIQIKSTMSQFGWQFEKRFDINPGGPSAVTEWVLLLGGLEHDVAIPSLSWLVGMRTAGGTEFGIGPNFTPAGGALVIAAGVTYRTGHLNVPFNVAVVPGKAGLRVSVLTGLNVRRR
jgi:hypothetical protein